MAITISVLMAGTAQSERGVDVKPAAKGGKYYYGVLMGFERALCWFMTGQRFRIFSSL